MSQVHRCRPHLRSLYLWPRCMARILCPSRRDLIPPRPRPHAGNRLVRKRPCHRHLWHYSPVHLQPRLWKPEGKDWVRVYGVLRFGCGDCVAVGSGDEGSDGGGY